MVAQNAVVAPRTVRPSSIAIASVVIVVVLVFAPLRPFSIYPVDLIRALCFALFACAAGLREFRNATIAVSSFGLRLLAKAGMLSAPFRMRSVICWSVNRSATEVRSGPRCPPFPAIAWQ